MARARILEDGTAYFGPEDTLELEGKEEKPKVDWTQADRETFNKLLDTIRQLVEEGEDIYDVRVKPKRMDFETELNYRKKGSDDTFWEKKIVRNKTNTQISDLEADTEYELRLRQRFIKEDGTPMEWGQWEPTRIMRTKPAPEAQEDAISGVVA